MKATILLAEDDSALSYLIQDNLQEAGYTVTTCENGESAWQLFQKNSFDICLLDINMPIRDGYSLSKKIRQQSDLVPIIFITAKSLEEDKLKGFASGADDYIVKPFSMKELIMRIEVFLKRTKKIAGANNEIYKLGTLTFMYNDLKISGENEESNVTQKEADLIKFFASHPNKILKREEILLNVWGKDDYFLGRSMDVFITKIRKHFKPDPSINLETIHGVGFRLNV